MRTLFLVTPTRRFLAAALALLAPLAACSTNPTTGRSQLSYLSRSEEISMGQQATPEITQEYGGAVNDQRLQAYLRRVGSSLAAQSEGDAPSLPWSFTLLNSDEINAFALPGGKVFMTRGLASRLSDEAQMAAVLGHEIGHVTARHINDQIVRQTLAGVVATGVAAAAASSESKAAQRYGPVAVQIGGSLVLLKFSRNQESEADELGMRYMTKAGYDPRAALDVMKVLDEATKGGATPELLATHPYPDTRIERITKALQTTYTGAATSTRLDRYAERYRSEFLGVLRGVPGGSGGSR